MSNVVKSNGKKEIPEKLIKDKNDKNQKNGVKKKGGLNIDIHPLLLNKESNLEAVKTFAKIENESRFKSKKNQEENNPYLKQEGSLFIKQRTHRPKTIVLQTPGIHIIEGDIVRRREKERESENLRIEYLKKINLFPDKNLREDMYEPERHNGVEWWDRGYLKTNNYDNLEESNLIFDNQNCPISSYIQHPVIFNCFSPKKKIEFQHVYLTKKEIKKKRKIERQKKLNEKRARIKQGLEPCSPPKIKLKNLKNILANESIKDPTLIEMKVRSQINERLKKHLMENELRKLSKAEKKKKLIKKQENDCERSIHCTVYKITGPIHSLHFYKIDINAKQLRLRGLLLINPRFNLIVAEGGLKSINFYKKLLCKRIKWSEFENNDILNNNIPKCSILWEGTLKFLDFGSWLIIRTYNDDEAINASIKFKIENFWRQAFV